MLRLLEDANPCLGNGFFLRRWPASWVYFTPAYLECAHIATKFQRLSQAFQWCHFRYRDVDIRQKSKLAVAKMKCTDLRIYG